MDPANGMDARDEAGEIDLVPDPVTAPGRVWTKRRLLIVGGLIGAITLVGGGLVAASLGDGPDRSVALVSGDDDGDGTGSDDHAVLFDSTSGDGEWWDADEADAAASEGGDGSTTTVTGPTTTAPAAAANASDPKSKRPSSPTTTRPAGGATSPAPGGATPAPGPSPTTTAAPSAGSPRSTTTSLPQGSHAPGVARAPSGFWTVDAFGKVTAHDGAVFHGDVSGLRPRAPITAFASSGTDDPNQSGYYLVSEDGGVYTFGSARFFGSTGAITTDGPVTDLWVTATGNGYWILDAGGTIYAFGDAAELEPANAPPNAVAVAVAAAPGGAWVLTERSGVVAVGDAPALGGGQRNGMLAVDLVPSPSGGYWVLYEDGSVEAVGGASGLGSSSQGGKATALMGTHSGTGYWIVHADGAVARKGNA